VNMMNDGLWLMSLTWFEYDVVKWKMV